MKKSLLILIALFVSVIGYSQTVGDTFIEGFVTYEVTSVSPNEVEISSYNTTGGTELNVPATTTNNLITYAVTATGFNSLNGKGLTAVTFSNNIISIGQQSLANNSLTSVTFPNNLINIGPTAFNNNNLTHVTIPSTVTDIGFAAFRDNPLATVTSQGTTPATVLTGGINDSFNIRNVIDLTIPSSTSATYAAGGWTGFNSVTEAAALAVGDTFIVDYITYEVTSVSPDNVEAIDYDMAGGTVIDIPATVPFSVVTYNVTSIGLNAFFQKGLTGEVIIPNSVINIGMNAFRSNNLTSVIIDDSVTDIGSSAFFQNQLNSVVFGNSVTTIGFLAFGQNNLTSIDLPDSVTEIIVRAFEYNSISSVTLPANVTDIGLGVFRHNPLTSVISLGLVPPTIITESNSNDTFHNFGDRSNINLILTGNTTNDYVTDNGALWTGFKMVFEATSATTVKVTDYDAANGLIVSIPATITIPAVTTFNVTEIGDSAFYDKGLTSVSIPDSVIDIGISAFELNSLSSVTIPDNVTAIGTTAFATNLLTDVLIGANVTTIGIGAFVDNDLTDITIPSNVTSIDLLAFGNNPLLASVTSLALVPPAITTGTNDTFIFNRSNTALHIPAGTMDAYVTNPSAGSDWSGFNPVTEDAGLSTSDFELAHAVKVFTTANAIKIMTSNTIRLENYTIYSITGAKVATGTEHEIATASFASGIYVLKLDFDKGTVTKKIVVN